MSRTTRTVTSLAAGLSTLAVAVLSGCSAPSAQVTWRADGMPEYDHPVHDWWRHQFVYHPAAEVYFEPYTGTFFWFEDGQWREGATLPAEVKAALQEDGARVVKTWHDKPYMHHTAVVAQGGPHHRPGHPEPTHLWQDESAYAAAGRDRN